MQENLLKYGAIISLIAAIVSGIIVLYLFVQEPSLILFSIGAIHFPIIYLTVIEWLTWR